MTTLSAQERDLQAQNTYKRRQNIAVGVRKPVFCVEARPSEAHPEHTGCVFCKIVMCQIVTLCLPDFYLVEDMGSWDAENEGLSLFLQFK